jgi:heme-degrading monooxygenase HmoA
MFARVVTAQAGPQGLDGLAGLASLAKEQLPDASGQPGFKGFYLLTNAETGKLITISLWETQEHMEAVESQAGATRHHQAAELGLTPPQLDTYEVTMQA